MKQCTPRGTTVFQDLAALAGKRLRGYDSLWALMREPLTIDQEWWEHHRADVEAAVRRVVEGMRKEI